MGRAGGDCGSGSSYFTTSPKRRAKGLGGGGLRHRGLHLHRHLIAPNLKGYRTDGGMVSRTRSVLQILHAPPSLPYLVVVGNKLRPHLRDVKGSTTTSCGTHPKEYDIVCNYSNLQQLRRHHPAGLGNLFSAWLPPVIRHFSTAFPQAFAQPNTRAFLRKSTCSPQDLRLFFVRDISTKAEFFFISFFVLFPKAAGGLSRKKYGRN